MSTTENGAASVMERGWPRAPRNRLARAVALGLAAAGAMALSACSGGGGEAAPTARAGTGSPTRATRIVQPRHQGPQTAAAPAEQKPTPQAQTAAPTEPSITSSPEQEPARLSRVMGDRQAWRPSWWIASPVREGGQVKVAAMADAADLLEARRKAVEIGLSDLRAHLEAAADEPVDAATTIDVLPLPDGRYRAFVLVEAPM